MKTSEVIEPIPEAPSGNESTLKKKEKLNLKDFTTVPTSEVERANLYYDLQDENGKLKEKLEDYEGDIKEMTTKLIYLQGQLEVIQRKTGKGKKYKTGTGEDIQSLLDQNKELKERVRRTDAVLKSMHVISLIVYREVKQIGRAACRERVYVLV